MEENVVIGLYNRERISSGENEGRYLLHKICSCGESSTAEYIYFKDVPSHHECEFCGNKNFLEENSIQPNSRKAVPIFYDISSSSRGFDFKKTNLSIIYKKEEKTIEVIQTNLVRRVVFDWVDKVFKIYRNGELEYDWNSEENEYGALDRVDRHIKRGYAGSNGFNDMLQVLNLEGENFYKYLKNRNRGGYYYNNQKNKSLVDYIIRALKYNGDYNWAQILASAGYPEIKKHSWYNDTYNQEATKPHKILGIPKKVSSYIKDLDTLDENDIRSIQILTKDADKLRIFYSLLDNLPSKESFTDILKNINDIYFLITRHSYDTKTIIEYILNDIHLYQGISDPSEGVTLLKDYVSMSSQMRIEYKKYPQSLKREHDVCLINYEVYTKDRGIQDFEQSMMENDYLVDTESSNEYCIILPESSQDLVVEGGKLNHCVGSYVDRVKKGDTVIAFLRNKEDMKEPLVTVEVKDWRIKQARGKHNRGLTESENKYLEEWSILKQLDYRY